MKSMKLSLLFLLLLAGVGIANESEIITISHVAERLIFGAEFVTRLLWVVCVVMGVSFIIISFTYFRAHRFNPKMVPLGKPIMYVVLGLVLIAIPFLQHFFGETTTGSPFETKKKKEKETEVHTYDIDAPLR